ncbi:uncharacterized protein I206_106943 [Kwoniella pini CBS 10737]|uniref:Uncharacterized protein n=1 Tax=Kwoniella pini CBS 10737 TaxID=1296096 RepID=A0A1B9HZL8_9TREE|nr:uncharacterized protein I206_05514 [Kwoniella pini CBS 10737]OCF48733.1 hypothetical protein I206_05514 [Kwoniella pini CBS 10737]
MFLQASIAGPSRCPYNTPSIHSDPPSTSRASSPSLKGRSSTPSLYRGSSVSSIYRRSSTPSLLGRSSTPILFPNGGRIRSNSVKAKSQTDEEKRQEEIEKRKIDSQQKLKSAWELIKEKYGSIRIEDDDEIDLRTGKITRDRGKLREYVGREFGQVSDNEDEDGGGSSIFGGTQVGETEFEFESDEDELGQWDERSGLDLQYSDAPLFEEEEEMLKKNESWDTPEAQNDLEEFLRLEAEQKKIFGLDNDVSEDADTEEIDDGSSSEDHDQEVEEDSQLSPRSRGSWIKPPRLEDLFLSDNEVEEREEASEDELLMGRDGFTEALSGMGLDVDEHVTTSDDEPFTGDLVESPPQIRPKRIVEVVIPIQSRRSSLPASTQYKQPQLGQSRIQTSVSAPSLASLFESPPPDDDLCSRSSSPALRRSPSPDADCISSPPGQSTTFVTSFRPQANLFQSPLPLRRIPPDLTVKSFNAESRHRTFSAEEKGKSRMIGERPSEDIEQHTTTHSSINTSGSPYYTRLWRSKYGAVKICKRCKRAGGERAEKAAWCKGRKGALECTFENSKPNQHDDRVQEPNLHPQTLEQRYDRSKHDSNRMGSSSRHSDDDNDDYHHRDRPDLRQTPSSGKAQRVRKCPLCREAGGQRGEQAFKCRGRVSSKMCRWYTIDLQTDDTDSAHLSPEANHGESISKSRRSLSRLTTDISDTDNSPAIGKKTRASHRLITTLTDSENDQRIRSARTPIRAMSEFPEEPTDRPDNLDPNIYCKTMIYRKSGRARYCGQCYDAGGDRKDRAWWCKGRAWVKFCYFSTNNDEEELENPEEVRDTRSSTFAETPQKPPQVSHNLFSSSVNRTKRKRIISSELPQLSATLSSPTSHHVISYMPSPPPTSSVEPYSPVVAVTKRTENVRSSSACSMPPSSPPVSTSSTRPVHPTPSPSLSASLLDASPISQKYPSLSLLRGATIGFRPTPPSSTDGARGSSVLSHYIPSTLPRKGILRRPSECSTAPSSSGSVKRARFSLQPRSPERDDSPDPLQSDEDEPFLGGDEDVSQIDSSIYAGSSSPIRAFNRYASSSSPLRNEWSVRARDIGIQLGPEHTGSLPRGMIKALVPSLGSSTSNPSIKTGESTLGSSVLVNRFALPTPPPSSGPVVTTQSRFTATRAGSSPSCTTGGPNSKKLNNTNTNNGLMLPPPVPLKRFTPAPSPAPNSTPIRLDSPNTPMISRSESVAHQSQSEPLNRMINARSRSRSISIAPSSSSSSSSSGVRLTTPSYKGPLRVISTTPRKKSRVERELARKAQEMDDAGLEWGMDEDTEDGGRMWREGSIVMLHNEL